MSLARIQGAFQDYVLAGDREQPAIANLINQRHGLAARERLAIYYDAYRIRLKEALAEAFGKTYGYVGDELFDDLCQSYVDAHPSTFRNLRWFGDQFATHVAATLPDYPVVAELAMFEWALGLAFDAADAPVLAMAELQQLDASAWESIGFALQPSLQLLPLHWNAPALWLALGKEEAPPDAAENPVPLTWLVWRKALQPHFRSLDRFEAGALAGLAAGHSFAEVCAEAAESAELAGVAEEDITGRIAGWLHTWISEEMLTAYRLPTW
jgi:hypothetical protein